MEGSSQYRVAPGWVIGAIALGVGLKAILLLMEAFPFHADEAVVGLMARHILRGEWPTFFYGQAYMGSLDAALVALAYQLTGRESVLAIRLVQSVLYAATIATSMLLAQSIFRDRRIGIFTGALMALPAVNVTLYTTVSLGGYGEALLIGNLLLLAALGFSRDPSRSWLALAWAAMAGFGIWVFGITLVFSLPSGILVIRAAARSRRGAERAQLGLWLVICAAAGAAPWLLSALRQGPRAFVSELLGSAIAGASPGGALASVGSHLLGLGLFGPTVVAGLRPPWGTELLALPLAPIAAGVWLLVAYSGLRSLGRDDAAREGRWLLFGVLLSTLAGFVFTPFGADPSGRYFLPLAVPMAVAASEFLTRLPSSRLAWAALGAILLFNLWGMIQSALRNPPGITTQFNPETRVDAAQLPRLAELLAELGEARGYTTYWVAYPLAFHSAEQAIFVPRLPYHLDFRHTKRDNRYAPYNGMVESSPRVAYITSRHPELDARIRAGLERSGVDWSETVFGEYRIFHDLSAPVRPEALDLAGPE